jgi:hypothetical protein
MLLAPVVSTLQCIGGHLALGLKFSKLDGIQNELDKIAKK